MSFDLWLMLSIIPSETINLCKKTSSMMEAGEEVIILKADSSVDGMFAAWQETTS